MPPFVLRRPRSRRRVSPGESAVAAEVLEPRALLTAADPLAGFGLTAEYFSGSLAGEAAATRTDATVDFDWGRGAPDQAVTNADGFRARFTGSLTARHSDVHTLLVNAGPSDGVRVWVGGDKLVDTWDAPTAATQRADVALTAGEAAPIRVEYKHGTGTAKLSVRWSGPRELTEALPHELLTPAGPHDGNRPRGLLREYHIGSRDRTPASAAAVDGAVLFTPDDRPDRLGRLRGLLVAPETGVYRFRLAGDADGTVHLSRDDAPGGERILGGSAGDQSERIRLTAGRAYYLEVLGGAGTAEVLWETPAGDGPESIAARRLRAFRPNVELRAATSVANEAGGAAVFTVTRDDDLGRDLDVHYTLGGDAVNGADYDRLPGVATITKGARTAEIVVRGVDDGVAEGAESVVVRLVPTGDYTLGPEFARRVTGTITGELPDVPGTELLADDPLAAGNYGTRGDATFTNFSAGLPPGVAGPGLRVTVADPPENPWQARPIWYTADRVGAGDAVLAEVWLRGTAGGGGPAQVSFVFERNGSPYTKSVSTGFSVSAEWEKYLVPFTAAENYDYGGAAFFLSVGHAAQTVEMAGLNVVSYGDATTAAALPRTVADYGGRGDDAWRAAADAGVEANRRGELEVVVVDRNGNRVHGAEVTATLRSHDFGFGAAVSRKVLSPSYAAVTGRTPDPRDRSIYEATAQRLFNRVVAENALKWNGTHWNPEHGQELIDWANARGIEMRGHTLIWGDWDFAPAEIEDEYQNRLDAGGAAAAKDWLKETLLDRVRDAAAAYGGAIEGDPDVPRVAEWDVINHPEWSDTFWNIVGDDFLVDVYAEARRLLHPNSKLYMNEGAIIRQPWGSRPDEYFATLQLLKDAGAEVDGVGFMSHFDSGRLPGFDEMTALLDRFAGLGYRMQATEFDVDDLAVDAQTQADFHRDYLRLMYSRPEVDGVVMWGFWEGAHWLSEEGAAPFAADWSVLPHGRAWVDEVWANLMTRAVGTADADGVYAARGFRGSYDVTASFGGATAAGTAELSADGGRVTIRLDVDAPDDGPDEPVDPVNAAPELTIGGTAAILDAEGNNARLPTAFLKGVRLADADGDAYTRVAVAFSAATAARGDALNVKLSGLPFAGRVRVAGAGTPRLELTVSGAPLTGREVRALLGRVLATPGEATGPGNSRRAVTVAVTDAGGPGGSPPQTTVARLTARVAAINDRPTWSAYGSVARAEVSATRPERNLFRHARRTGRRADRLVPGVDADDDTATGTPARVLLTARRGTLAVSGGGLRVVRGGVRVGGAAVRSGNGTGTVVVEGDPAALRRLLRGVGSGRVTYVPPDRARRSDKIKITLSDAGDHGFADRTSRTRVLKLSFESNRRRKATRTAPVGVAESTRRAGTIAAPALNIAAGPAGRLPTPAPAPPPAAARAVAAVRDERQGRPAPPVRPVAPAAAFAAVDVLFADALGELL